MNTDAHKLNLLRICIYVNLCAMALRTKIHGMIDDETIDIDIMATSPAEDAALQLLSDLSI